ncbi:MAG: DUF3352 domain-containing protein [Bacteroidales bacterium]|nr:DUF3352 domain-containing protein [Bacteroidales bacterium]
MKRFLLSIILILILAGAAAIYLLRTRSGFDSLYLVPGNAVLIVETKDPLGAWQNIVHSSAWNHYRRNKFFNELNKYILSFDTLVNSNRHLLKLIGAKPVILSQHPTGKKEYDFLYIIEAGRIGRHKNPGKLAAAALGKGFEISSRDYKGYKILDILDKDEGGYSFMSFVRGKILFSFSHNLIEQSIDASQQMELARKTAFQKVRSKLNNRGLLRMYFIHSNLNKYIAVLSPEGQESFQNATKNMLFSGISFAIDKKGEIEAEGYSSFADTSALTYPDVLYKGSLDILSSPVIPDRVASLVKINFGNAGNYILNSMKVLGNDEYKDYMLNTLMIEKHLKISLNKNLYSWMKDEVVFLQTQPSNLGQTNEFAAILNAADSAIAADNMRFIYKQIRKNTPVKIKTVNYRGYNIDYIAFPGILKVLMGKTLKKIEKPYVCQINKSLIISNHPQTIKNIIDDYFSGNTLANAERYKTFANTFADNTSAWIYVEPQVLYHNLKYFVTPETWQQIQNNKEYITCFEQLGLQISVTGLLMQFKLKTQYVAQVENWKKPFYDAGEILNLFNYSEATLTEAPPEVIKTDTIPEFFVSDFDARKYEEYYENGSPKLVVELKNGLKHGNLRYYYPSGQVKLKGSYKNDLPAGKWKYFSENGDLIKVDEY